MRIAQHAHLGTLLGHQPTPKEVDALRYAVYRSGRTRKCLYAGLLMPCEVYGIVSTDPLQDPRANAISMCQSVWDGDRSLESISQLPHRKFEWNNKL